MGGTPRRAPKRSILPFNRPSGALSGWAIKTQVWTARNTQHRVNPCRDCSRLAEITEWYCDSQHSCGTRCVKTCLTMRIACVSPNYNVYVQSRARRPFGLQHKSCFGTKPLSIYQPCPLRSEAQCLPALNICSQVPSSFLCLC